MNAKSRSSFVGAYAALLILLAGSVGVAFLHLGAVTTIVGLLIASIQMMLITLYFMELRFSGSINWLVAGGSLLWLGILFVLVMSDYATRNWTG
ncbi:MAG TPA: cytochrome C oxidase subunit IV family protein [Chthoniobacterales bacterium]|nr:cytochrome C oxidase subunit IV family protein [Chthoniobacterales bacterium]